MTIAYRFPNEQEALDLIAELRTPRTTAEKVTSRGAYLLRPQSLGLQDSAKAAEEDAHKVVRLLIKQLGFKAANVPSTVIEEKEYDGTDFLYLSKGLSTLVWFRTAQPNGGQSKTWVELREKVLPFLYPEHTVITTTYFSVPSDSLGLITHTPQKAWEIITGDPQAYGRIEQLFSSSETVAAGGAQ